MTITATPRQVLIAVDDITASIEFLVQFGFSLRFRDRDRWAVLGSGSLEVALASRGEAPDGGFALTVRTADLDSAMRHLAEQQGVAIGTPLQGQHEVRTTCVGPGGLRISLYQPLEA